MFTPTTMASSSASAAPLMESTVTDKLAALDVVSNAKGQKHATLDCEGMNAFWVLPGPVVCLWQPSVFKGMAGVTARSMCLTGGGDMMNEARALDAWAVQYATQNSERLFGKVLSREQVIDRYNGVLKANEKYPAFLKLKPGTDSNAPNFWDGDKNKRDARKTCRLHDALQGVDHGLLVYGIRLRPQRPADRRPDHLGDLRRLPFLSWPT